MSDNLIKLTISTEAGQSAEQFKVLGEAMLSAKQAAGATDEELKAMQAALQGAADAATQAKAPADAFATALAALVEQQRALSEAEKAAAAAAAAAAAEAKRLADEQAAAEARTNALKGAMQELVDSLSGGVGQFAAFIHKVNESEAAGGKLAAALTIGTGVVGLLGSAWDRATQAIQTNAMEGEKASQAILGAQDHVADSMDNLMTSMTDGLAPAIAGIGSIMADVIDTITSFVKEGDNAKDMQMAMAHACQFVVSVMGGMVAMVDQARDAYSVLKYELGEVSEESEREFQAVQKSIQAHTKAFDSLQQKIFELKDKIEDGGTGLADVMEDEAKRSKRAGDIMSEMQQELTNATGASHAERIEIIKRYQKEYETRMGDEPAFRNKIDRIMRNEEKAAANDRIQDAKEAATRAQKQAEDDAKENLAILKARIENEAALAGGGAAAKLEATQAHYEEMQQALAGDVAAQLNLETQRAEAVAKVHEEEAKAAEELAKRQLETAKETIQQRLEADEEYVQGMLNSAELQAANAEDLEKKLNDVYKSVADNAALSGKVREQAALKVAAAERKSMADISSAQQKLAADTKKHAAEQQASYDAMAKKIGTTIAGMVNKVIFEHKSLKEAMVETFKQILTQVVSSLTEMATTAIAKAVMTAVGVKAATTVEVAAHTQTMAAAVTSWAGAIPVVGPAIAAGVIASFKAMIMASGQGFESGKASEGRPVGLGNRDPDTPNARVGQDETVLTGAQTRALGGAEAIMAAAQGQGGGQASSGPQEIELKITFEKSGDDLIDFLMKRMTFLVLNKRVRLAASELRA